jgi:hypothetical protein
VAGRAPHRSNVELYAHELRHDEWLAQPLGDFTRGIFAISVADQPQAVLDAVPRGRVRG